MTTTAEEVRVHVTHQVLVGVGFPCRELEVLASNEQEEEEGQHEKLPVPHRHDEDLRAQHKTKSITLQTGDTAFKSQKICFQNTIFNGFNHILNLMASGADSKASEICRQWQKILLSVV